RDGDHRGNASPAPAEWTSSPGLTSCLPYSPGSNVSLTPLPAKHFEATARRVGWLNSLLLAPGPGIINPEVPAEPSRSGPSAGPSRERAPGVSSAAPA